MTRRITPREVYIVLWLETRAALIRIWKVKNR